MTAPKEPVDFLFRDPSLAIVNKPSGLACHRGRAQAKGDYVLTRVRDGLGAPVWLAHRLDRATSGAVALVTAPELVAPLAHAFAQGAVVKRYLAIVRGVMPPEVFVDYPVPGRSEGDTSKVPAQTYFSRLGTFEDRYSLVEARPITGRLHQLRRHLRHLRHPILGDTTYGDTKQNHLCRARFGLMRLALHASVLALPHPLTGRMVRVCAPLSADLAQTLAQMGLSPALSSRDGLSGPSTRP